MELENIVTNCKNWFQENITHYSRNKSQLKSHIAKTAIGGSVILILNALNAPDIIDIVAYLYTFYNGNKAYRDLKCIQSSLKVTILMLSPEKIIKYAR